MQLFHCVPWIYYLLAKSFHGIQGMTFQFLYHHFHIGWYSHIHGKIPIAQSSPMKNLKFIHIQFHTSAAHNINSIKICSQLQGLIPKTQFQFSPLILMCILGKPDGPVLFSSFFRNCHVGTTQLVGWLLLHSIQWIIWHTPNNHLCHHYCNDSLCIHKQRHPMPPTPMSHWFGLWLWQVVISRARATRLSSIILHLLGKGKPAQVW